MSVLSTNYLTPTGAEEAWRFTPLKRLRGLHDGSIAVSMRESINLTSEIPAGVEFKREILAPINQSGDLIVNRVRENSSSVAHLSIPTGTLVTEPIILGRVNSSLDSAEYSRFRISIGENVEATIVIENTSDTILAEDLEIDLSTGAKLKFITLQEFDSNSVFCASHSVSVGKDATLKSITVTVGGDVVRILPSVIFTAPGGEVELLGVYFATAGQFFEHRMHIDHAVPNAKSNVNFKGAITGKDSHTVWIGDVSIRPQAEGTKTYELNRNLLLSDGARADSVPNLEIETGEIVGAGHASTTGRFDDEQLFYLTSRGICMADARRLVIRGFFHEIVSEIGIEEIQERIMSRIDNELEKASKND